MKPTTHLGSEGREQTGQYTPSTPPTAEPIKQQAKEIVEQAQVQTKAALSSRKDQAVSELENLAKAFRQTGEQLESREQSTVASYIDQFASQVERFSTYLDNRDMDELLDEAEALARRHPDLFLGGAFALGLLAARFLKTSARQARAERRTERERREYSLQRPTTPVSVTTPGRPRVGGIEG